MLVVESDGNGHVARVEEWKVGEQIVLDNSKTPRISVHDLIGVGSFQTMRIRGSCGT